MICPMFPRVKFKATASVVALVFRRFAVSQLRRHGLTEYVKLDARQSIAYRALNAVGGNAPVTTYSHELELIETPSNIKRTAS